MNNETIALNIEALLFALGGPMSRLEISKALTIDISATEEALTLVRNRSEGHGIVLVDDGKEVELRASADASDVIERVRKENYTRDIGRAGLETLAAILYKGPLSRSEIDFIRGVNSSQIVRTLTIRGLVRKIANPKDMRSFLYEATTELLAELGVTQTSELHDQRDVQEKLTALETAYKNS